MYLHLPLEYTSATRTCACTSGVILSTKTEVCNTHTHTHTHTQTRLQDFKGTAITAVKLNIPHGYIAYGTRDGHTKIESFTKQLVCVHAHCTNHACVQKKLYILCMYMYVHVYAHCDPRARGCGSCKAVNRPGTSDTCLLVIPSFSSARVDSKQGGEKLLEFHHKRNACMCICPTAISVITKHMIAYKVSLLVASTRLAKHANIHVLYVLIRWTVALG